MDEAKCYECGMPLHDGGEFHPYRACEVFKATHDSGTVRGILRKEFPDQADRYIATGEALPERQ